MSSETPEPQAEAPTPAPAKMTEYVVLVKNENGWSEAKRISARSAKAAVTAHVSATPAIEGGTFVAVPARSFEPITVKTETRTRLAFS